MIGLVLAGADLRITPRLRALADEADLVVAADAGLRHAEPLGVRPDLFVGDLDSVTPAMLAAWPKLPRETHPRDKNELDLELAAEAARVRGADRVRILGAVGDRLDQTVAALLIGARLARAGTTISLHDAAHDVHVLHEGDAYRSSLPAGTCFSLLALGDRAEVDVANAVYALHAAAVPFGTGLGLSNRAREGGPIVRVRGGTLLLIVQWEV